MLGRFQTGILVTVIFISIISFIPVNATLSIDSKINPDKVNVGDDSVLTVSVKNEGNATVEVTSIEIEPQWKIENPNVGYSLEPNKVNATSIDIKPPEGTQPGNYWLTLIVKTNQSDYISNAQLSVNALQGIPFSGEIPLSVIAIFIPGILAYFIIVYNFTRKFDRNYLEMGLLAVGFGLLSWVILGVLNNRSLYLILQSQPIDYILVFLIAIGIALIFVFAVYFGKFLYKRLKSSFALIDVNSQLRKKGYAIRQDPPWTLFIQEQLDFITTRINTDYTLLLRVSIKSSTNVIGLLHYFEMEPPYHISLRPKYVITCSKDDLIDLLVSKNSPLIGILEKDRELRDRVIQYFINNKISVRDKINLSHHGAVELFTEIDKIFYKSMSLSELEEKFSKLSLNKHILNIMRDLEELELSSILKEYGSLSFIMGEDIYNVEILKYETPYALIISDGRNTVQIPKVFDLRNSDFLHI
jgi:hypothetical protein